MRLIAFLPDSKGLQPAFGGAEAVRFSPTTWANAISVTGRRANTDPIVLDCRLVTVDWRLSNDDC